MMYEKAQIMILDIKNLVMNRMWLFYSTLFPMIVVAVLGYLSADLYGDKISSYTYYTYSFMIYTVFSTATVAANSFMEEKIKAGNMRILYSPVSAHFLYYAKLLASFLYCSCCHMLSFLLLIWLFSVPVPFGKGALFLLFILSEFFASCLGIMMCCLMKSESSANQLLSMVLALLAILGGCFFSMDRYGALLSTISALSPLKWIMEAVFTLVFDHQYTMLVSITGVLVLLSAVALLICRLSFHKEDCL